MISMQWSIRFKSPSEQTGLSAFFSVPFLSQIKYRNGVRIGVARRDTLIYPL